MAGASAKESDCKSGRNLESLPPFSPPERGNCFSAVGSKFCLRDPVVFTVASLDRRSQFSVSQNPPYVFRHRTCTRCARGSRRTRPWLRLPQRWQPMIILFVLKKSPLVSPWSPDNGTIAKRWESSCASVRLGKGECFWIGVIQCLLITRGWDLTSLGQDIWMVVSGWNIEGEPVIGSLALLKIACYVVSDDTTQSKCQSCYWFVGNTGW